MSHQETREPIVTIDEEIMKRASAVIPGGVNSPVRAFKGVGGTPVFISEAKGPYVYDHSGRKFIDYVGSWGPMILGHAAPAVLEAIHAAAAKGTSYGAPTLAEVELAELICSAIPGLDMLRLTSSGTEACMSALRLARAFTGRDAILKFEGCYHGHGDCLLVKAGSGAATFGTPSSAGVPAGTARDTLVAPYNDLEATRAVIAERGFDQVAAVILEPICGNMGVVKPLPEFLTGLRALCDEHGILLIVDEVMTGFRVAWGGAQTLLNLRADISCYGKVVGGGLPLAAFGGRREIMEKLAPLGPCYQAGTLSGNPLAVAAGLATLRELQRQGDAFDRLEAAGARLQAGLEASLKRHGVAGVVPRVGSMITLYFTKQPRVDNFSQAALCDHKAFGRFFHAMLQRGVSLPPSGYEAWFFSLAHSEALISETLAAADASIAEFKG